MRILIILLFVSFSAFSQEDIERYKLYPTLNINIFLKLDTSTGLMWIVQKASSDVESFEQPINVFQFAHLQEEIDILKSRNVDWVRLNKFTKSETPIVGRVGRFKLYPTDNMFNFLLQDVISGDTFQVQWGFSFTDHMIFKIEDPDK